MYLNISNNRLRKASFIGYLLLVVFVPVLYYATGTNDPKAIVAYVTGIVIFPGIIILANWIRHRSEPTVTASHHIKNIKADRAAIRERVILGEQQKKWRLVDEGDDWFKLETPVRFPSYGEYIFIKLDKEEVKITNKPKVSQEQHTDVYAGDKGEEVADFLKV